MKDQYNNIHFFFYAITFVVENQDCINMQFIKRAILVTGSRRLISIAVVISLPRVFERIVLAKIPPQLWIIAQTALHAV